MRQVVVTTPRGEQVLVTSWPLGNVEVDFRPSTDGGVLWQPIEQVGGAVAVAEVAA